ncbi:putative cation efflux protein [Gordonia araii NBRC 100433]|uniref:Putative cation efflux protein n=1 Tax=Gordonia araii NBRC 100433 TaxID=1073574 RepID=G7H2Z1_9ACTN|nr:cation diffusion facilitator family transporter [Gordonia araii]NNG98300.1 cation transporter [Gordonia araii NBRC 100433]GAB10216.1 putative cation efflux protein [Gordonia araii NBRC 100433]
MGHSHDHSHAGEISGHRRLWPMVLSVVLIGSFFVVELVTGILANSLALIADAGHMATDLVALLMGLSALLLARHGSLTARRSFGWHRAEVFSAIVNAVLLIGVGAFVLYEAIERIGSDPQVPGWTLIIVALLGLAVNVVVMVLLRADAKASIAVRGAYLEVLADAVGSVGVLVAGVFALITGSGYADIVVAVLIALWVVPRAIRLAADALRILNQQAPNHIDVEAVETQLAAINGVIDVHDLHVWTLTTGMDVATVHVTSSDDGARVLAQAQEILAAHGLEHATVQVESTGGDGCRDSELSW